MELKVMDMRALHDRAGDRAEARTPYAGGATAQLPRLAGVHGTKVFETTRQPFLVLDDLFRVVTANTAFWRQFQLAPDATVGRSLWSAGDGEWASLDLRGLLELLLSNRQEINGYELIGEFGGIRRVLLVDGREIIQDDLEGERFILVGLEDVTVQRTAQALTERARVVLERSNRDLQEFASVASHDLQEPLRKILAFGERLQSRAQSSLDDVAKDYLARMLDASRRMRRLIDDALECSRVSIGSAPFAVVQLDVALRDALANVSLPADARVDAVPLPSIEADAGQMRQLFQNLLTNAFKFKKDDIAPSVTISARRAESGEWALTFADNGIGFDPEHGARMFAMFQRLHGRRFEGSGIGLAVCRRIVERHHGSIEAHGILGSGATFTVRLPEQQPMETL
jgi:signal transduction histidine kinase